MHFQEYAFLDAPLPLAFAHRGGAGSELENSMAAFERAVGLGYRYLETDVHATADGVLLAFHDRTFHRVTDARGRLARLTYADVAGARIGGAAAIPRLEDILGAWPDARLNVDVEGLAGHRAADRHHPANRRARSYLRRVILRSPAGAGSGRARTAALHIARAMGVLRLRASRTRACSAELHRPHSLRPASHPALAQLAIVDARLIDAAHRRGVHVHVWTIDDPASRCVECSTLASTDS